MLIFDQLKKADRSLQVLSIGILLGMGVLLSGLWYVQIVSAKKHRESLKTQSFRTVRLPAIRGKILDRNNTPLVENQPNYTINLYLEELRSQFQAEYSRASKELRSTKPNGKLTGAEIATLGRQSRYRVASNIVFQVSVSLQLPLLLGEPQFRQHYEQRLALPLPILESLTSQQVAQFIEKAQNLPGVELEIQPIRVYPYGQTAAHLLGYLRRDDSVKDEQDLAYNYRLPDFVGRTGIEGAFDKELRGQAGMKSMLVNNLGYRQSEEIWIGPEAGQNLTLTIDLPLQQATEKALRGVGAGTRSAAVVLDVRTGDILALASAPSFDPNLFLGRISQELWTELNDEKLKPMFNRATFGAYAPGSIFKIVVGLACLESGVVRAEDQFYSKGYYQLNARSKPIGDTAGAGHFDFSRAFLKSSNPYFIEFGLKAGRDRILDMANRFHLGTKYGLPTMQEVSGYIPKLGDNTKVDGGPWLDGDTANLSIGQGEITVTPIQMAVMVAAVANGGKVLNPRLVSRLESQDALGNPTVTNFPVGQVLNDLRVHPEYLQIVRQAMRADVVDPQGTGKAAEVAGMEVSGKTGTAEVKRGRQLLHKITWFSSFAPFSQPRYSVIVMVEEGGSGGGTCAPVAQKIYQAIQKREAGVRNIATAN